MIPQLEPLEDRICPAVVVFHGGAVLAHPEVTNAYVGVPANLDAFAQVLVGPYASLLSPYGVGQGKLAASVSLPNQGAITDAQVQQLLTQEIAAGVLPAPGANSVYMVYLPEQTTDHVGSGGYHSYFNLGGLPVPYSVVFTQPSETVAAAHEFAEAATDPIPGTGWTTLGGIQLEIADLYDGQSFSLGGFLVSEFALPDGSMVRPPSMPLLLMPPVPPGPQPHAPADPLAVWRDLAGIAVDQFEALTFRCLVLIDPRDFAGRAAAEQQQLASHPSLHTPPGQYASALGWAAFSATFAPQP